MEPSSSALVLLAFQSAITGIVAVVYWALWRHERRRYFRTWAGAWALYAVRLGFISAFLSSRSLAWLLAHQLATGATALLLLGATLQFAQERISPNQRRAIAAAAVLWVGLSGFGVQRFAIGGLTSAVALSLVTLWTGVVFWRHWRRSGIAGSLVLAVAFGVWGLHHLDYPLLRPLGSGILFGGLVDVVLITVTAGATLFLVLTEGKLALAQRTAQLEQLTRLLLQTQEDERRRLARELHDEAGQILTAAKIELDLEGRTEVAGLVERVLVQIRSLSRRLRPSELDDLGLLPALRSLVDDFRRRARIHARFQAPASLECSEEVEVVLYRVVQEALTNVARHAGAQQVEVSLRREDDRIVLAIHDDGVGASPRPAPHLGLLGIRERVAGVSGSLEIFTEPGKGFRLQAAIPVAREA